MNPRHINYRELINEAQTYLDKLNIIRSYYNTWEHMIMEYYEKYPGKYYSVNELDWPNIFTPIESLAWYEIRVRPGIVMYPQYPAGKYTIDFANPHLKIGLEFDGARYHDIDRDRKRDTELYDMGWTIYRIKGSEIHNTELEDRLSDLDVDEDEYEKLYAKWLKSSGSGVIESIRAIHFGDYGHSDYDHHYKESLQLHKIHP